MPLFEHDLRVRLRERCNRLYRADFRIWPNEAGMMLTWMRSEPYLAALLDEIEAAPIDTNAWRSSGGISYQSVSFPEDEHQRAKVCLSLFESKDVQSFGHAFGGDGDFNDMCRAFVDGAVDHVIHYIGGSDRGRRAAKSTRTAAADRDEAPPAESGPA